jgi:hypothetical protein
VKQSAGGGEAHRRTVKNEDKKMSREFRRPGRRLRVHARVAHAPSGYIILAIIHFQKIKSTKEQ